MWNLPRRLTMHGMNEYETGVWDNLGKDALGFWKRPETLPSASRLSSQDMMPKAHGSLAQVTCTGLDFDLSICRLLRTLTWYLTPYLLSPSRSHSTTDDLRLRN